MFRLLSAALGVLLVAMATPQYQLPDGHQDIVPGLVQTFSCDGRPFGYYADVANQCKVFHLCVPLVDSAGTVTHTDQFSFLCGNQTIFDQLTLTCNYPVDSEPCEDAEASYATRNAEFFKLSDGSDA